MNYVKIREAIQQTYPKVSHLCQTQKPLLAESSANVRNSLFVCGQFLKEYLPLKNLTSLPLLTLFSIQSRVIVKAQSVHKKASLRLKMYH